jgi:AraC-like DNA-binding protein
MALAGTTREVKDIAESLGHSKPGALAGAFRRWGGTPPSPWRAQQAVKAENPR